MALLDKLNFHDKLIHLLTAYDMRQSKTKHYNPNALALYFIAAKGVTDAQTFAASFTPSGPMHTIAKKLDLGLDVDRGHWVLPKGD